MDCFPCKVPSSSNVVMGNKEEKKKGGKRSKGVKLSTDPQSVAARQRRHRISERFKILQSLVPGGTKMDTVSMLDEAIHYVKFLKTQIWLHQAMMNVVEDDTSLFFPSVSSLSHHPSTLTAVPLPSTFPPYYSFQGDHTNVASFV